MPSAHVRGVDVMPPGPPVMSPLVAAHPKEHHDTYHQIIWRHPDGQKVAADGDEEG